MTGHPTSRSQAICYVDWLLSKIPETQVYLTVILAMGRSIIERTDLGFASNLMRVLISLTALKNAPQSWGD